MLLVTIFNSEANYNGVFDCQDKMEAAKAAFANMVEVKRISFGGGDVRLEPVPEDAIDEIDRHYLLNFDNLICYILENGEDPEELCWQSTFLVTVEEYELGTMLGPT